MLVDSMTAYKRGSREAAVMGTAWSMIASGLFIMPIGTYGTVLTIMKNYGDGSTGSVSQCTDNL